MAFRTSEDKLDDRLTTVHFVLLSESFKNIGLVIEQIPIPCACQPSSPHMTVHLRGPPDHVVGGKSSCYQGLQEHVPNAVSSINKAFSTTTSWQARETTDTEYAFVTATLIQKTSHYCTINNSILHLSLARETRHFKIPRHAPVHGCTPKQVRPSQEDQRR